LQGFLESPLIREGRGERASRNSDKVAVISWNLRTERETLAEEQFGFMRVTLRAAQIAKIVQGVG
jgi:hypothetical protein